MISEAGRAKSHRQLPSRVGGRLKARARVAATCQISRRIRHDLASSHLLAAGCSGFGFIVSMR